MREIKFRVFKNGKMYYPVHKSNAKNDDLLEVYFDSEPWNIKTSGFLMQYTGLKDENGRDIYEGDILKNETIDEEYVSPAVVVWSRYEEVGWALAFKSNHMKDCYKPLIHTINGIDLIEEGLMRYQGTYTVIGNIYENFNEFFYE